VVTICTTSLTFNSSTFRPHSVFMCFVWIWEQTAIISLYNINWMVFITERECVYCAVRTECLYMNPAAVDFPSSSSATPVRCTLQHDRAHTPHYCTAQPVFCCFCPWIGCCSRSQGLWRTWYGQRHIRPATFKMQAVPSYAWSQSAFLEVTNQSFSSWRLRSFITNSLCIILYRWTHTGHTICAATYVLIFCTGCEGNAIEACWRGGEEKYFWRRCTCIKILEAAQIY